ncbi:hypothetical protein NQ035_07535 [Staphylococcus gallinarum]|uniref:hypothetical protein n=2 Tax=Staphylococcus gallinarum TaxID=1293 RepID=UPI000D1CCD43|nr:hypothetical protein [Staphylococcus gallinarum]MCQ9288719.1 hypothetical protein [Staphylococcus gallinarum]PTE36187.1 hypothetical protein BUZ00_06070 [Staphylococcus gallinarum]PTK92398.1 hypothetical protein BUZ03_02475 [Staphylococcus gallinarum]RIL18281.1 hypothetical protein BUY99_13935 [Staphylococcus gallinarum]
MDNPTEIKYPFDDYGEPYYAATHFKAIQNIEDILKDSTDWIEFTPLSGKPNTEFKAEGDNGFNCSYREINVLGIVKIKSVRINLSNIQNGMTIANLPENFVSESQSWPIRTPNTHLPAIVSLRPNGKLTLVFNKQDTETWTETDYIYGSHTWIE